MILPELARNDDVYHSVSITYFRCLYHELSHWSLWALMSFRSTTPSRTSYLILIGMTAVARH